MNDTYLVISIGRSHDSLTFWNKNNFGYTIDLNNAKEFNISELEAREIPILKGDIRENFRERIIDCFENNGKDKVAIKISDLDEISQKSIYCKLI